jgi:hypothetical protein
MAGEVGEACNVIKKLDRERMGIRGSRALPGQLAEELADVVICADLIALAEGIDLDQAVTDKFNATSEKVGLATRLYSPSHRFGETGAVLIEVGDERRRHVEGKGWSPEHDDEHRLGELALAGAAYAVHASFLIHPAITRAGLARSLWPWSTSWWKPTSLRRCLVKAAALIIAEIERLDRAEDRSASR